MYNLKAVAFDVYCKKCKYASKSEVEDPCYDCLNQPVNTDSHKPEYFEENKDGK